MSDESNEQAITELELAQRIRDLDDSIEPDRDLWRGIERQILDSPQRRWFDRQDWMPWGVAASFVIATAALVLNLARPASDFSQLAQQPVSNQAPPVEYRMVHDPMVVQFDRVNSGLQTATRDDLMRNLDILRQARMDLEQELLLDPGNQRARQMLIRLHEQELALLKQDYLAPARTL